VKNVEHVTFVAAVARVLHDAAVVGRRVGRRCCGRRRRRVVVRRHSFYPFFRAKKLWRKTVPCAIRLV